MNKFMRSLLIGMGASIFLIGGIAGIGIWVSSEPGAGTDVASVAKDSKRHTVRMRPQSVQIGGYSLKSKKKAQILLVSVEMRVTGSHNFVKVCQLMPRLVSSVNTVFANLVSQTDNARDAITKNVQGQLKYRFNKALGAPLIDDVRMIAYQDEKDVPGTTCPEET
ncbi:MAG: hypothetical protein CMM61_11655 [Rhodospirillaceae bacterium]|nr:hypothetical protein [Rhodospirillaceae bacterium]